MNATLAESTPWRLRILRAPPAAAGCGRVGASLLPIKSFGDWIDGATISQCLEFDSHEPTVTSGGGLATFIASSVSCGVPKIRSTSLATSANVESVDCRSEEHTSELQSRFG